MNRIDTLSSELMIIAGIPMYVCGVIGNLLSICVFAIWSQPRRTIHENSLKSRSGNSPLYLLTTSVANFFLVAYPLAIRILMDGFGMPATSGNSLVLCKLRYYVLQTSLLTSLSCTCLATFDRYLTTSREVRLRQLSTTRATTKRILLLIICVSSLHSIPIVVYYDRSRFGDCFLNSVVYADYYLFVVVVFLYGIFPLCFLALFGRLTYKQLTRLQPVNRRAQSNIDKQISRMLLLECIALVCSYIPYCIQNIYFAKFFDGSSPISSFDFLFRIVTIILFYLNPAMSFYIFFISTPNFRQQVKRILLRRNELRDVRLNRIHTITSPHS